MIRKAKVGDIKRIQELINYFAGQDLMLPRSLNILYENLRDFFVCEDKNKIVGCSALHISWDDLAEIKSLAVAKNYQNKGIGRKLAEACILEAKEIGAGRVFVLTYAPDFFKKLGFRQTAHNKLPHKIWAECINCPKFPDCQETALIKKI
ncbi:MAG: N-acetyltransferase [Candidatus Omnitrophota bacterium]|nr:N-acetyltransferase [Candidatus Omnitrophota bacterium]